MCPPLAQGPKTAPVLNLKNLLRPTDRWMAALRVLFGALLLMGVIAFNGRPAVFADSNIYDWMGQLQYRPIAYALSPLTHGPASARQDPDAADESPADMQMRRTEMDARSPWYGMYLYGVESLGSLWGLAALQALILSFSLEALYRRLAPARGSRPGLAGWLGVMAGLCVFSTLPFFVGFAMPDVFIGSGLIGLFLLIARWRDLSALERAAHLFLVFLAFAFHRANGPVLLGAGGLLCLWLVFRGARPVPIRPAASVIGLFLAALALTAGYEGAIRHATGETLRSPPFLTARLLADGPGRVYLKAACARGDKWALCRYAKLPLNDSQDILWSGSAAKGVFSRATVAQRIAIDEEQTRFVVAVIASDPLGVISHALSNAVQEFTNVYLDDPLRDPHFYLTDPDWRDTFIADMVHRISDCDPDDTGCKPRFTEAQSRLWHGGAFAVAMAIILAWLAFTRKKAGMLESFCLFVLVALFLNAATTGALSGPFARYQARLSFLAPLCALLIAQGLMINDRQAPQDGLEGGDDA